MVRSPEPQTVDKGRRVNQIHEVDSEAQSTEYHRRLNPDAPDEIDVVWVFIKVRVRVTKIRNAETDPRLPRATVSDPREVRLREQSRLLFAR